MSTKETMTSSEDRVRSLICNKLTTLANAGHGQFRARWIGGEQRLIFEGERANRWEAGLHSDYHGDEARQILSTLESLKHKRNLSVQVRWQDDATGAICVFRVDADELLRHSRDLHSFFMRTLFWD